MTAFSGTKIVLLLDNQLLLIQRDNKPGLSFAGLWDFPGGGREGNETPIECALREVYEELAITVDPTRILWCKQYPSMRDPDVPAYFLVATISQTDVDGIVFGDEGQGWKLQSIADFLVATDVVKPLKGRLRDFLQSPNDAALV